MPVTLGVIAPAPAKPRPVGDAGTAASYRHPVIFHYLEGIPASAILRPEPNPDLFEPYLAAALDLQARGAQVIGTTCGFLSALQGLIAPRLAVPFVSSALLQLPLAQNITGRPPGVITADDAALTRVYLDRAGLSPAMPADVIGLQSYPAFTESAVKRSREMDLGAVEGAIRQAARDLLARSPETGSIVLECHNLPPFSAALRAETGLPVFDVITAMEHVAMALDRDSRFSDGMAP